MLLDERPKQQSRFRETTAHEFLVSTLEGAQSGSLV
jgi:hypothetical protein